MKKLLKISLLLPLVCSCTWINEKMHLKDDNAIEEIVEQIIHQETGLDLDLSPKPESEHS